MLSKKMQRQYKIWGSIIVLFYIVCFGFLTIHDFQIWTLEPFIESLIGTFMGAGAIAVITGIILVFQSSIQAEQEKKKAVFDKKLDLYEKIIDDIGKYFEEDDKGERKIDEKEKEKLFFKLLKVELLSKPATFKEFGSLMNNLSDDDKDGTISKDAYKNLAKFVEKAREDLDVQEKMTEVERKIFDDAIKITESEAEKASSGYGSRFSTEKGKYSESELSKLLSDYFSDKECKNEKQRRKKEKLNIFFNILLTEDRLFQREEIKHILIKEKMWHNHFEEDWGHRDYTSESGQVKTYEWYVGNYMSNISKDFSRPNNDCLRQILSFESQGRFEGEFEVKAGAAGSMKDSYYIEKEYRQLLKKILNNY